jgi:hypothetical protein
MTLLAEQYDFAISLLLLADGALRFQFESERELDVYERMVPEPRRRDW